MEIHYLAPPKCVKCKVEMKKLSDTRYRCETCGLLWDDGYYVLS